MVTDYEAAWVELSAYVASKTQHGREGLLGKMAELAHEHRVPAGELSRLLRLHGVEVERARLASVTSPDSGEDFAGGLASPTDLDRPGQHDRGGHDGGSGDGDGPGGAPGRADGADGGPAGSGARVGRDAARVG